MHSTFSSTHTGTSQKCTRLAPVSMHFSQYRNLSISAFCQNVNKAVRKNLSNILISGHIKTSSTYVFMWQNVTVQPLHLLVFIFMKTRSLVVPPYADLDEKVLMQASLQHTFSFKPAHGWTVTINFSYKKINSSESPWRIKHRRGTFSVLLSYFVVKKILRC